MKKSLSILFAALFILVTAGSLYAADLKVNGEYRVRGYNYNTVTGFDGVSDGADYIDQRFLMTGSITQGITTGVFEAGLLSSTQGVTSQGGYIWGNQPATQNISHGGIHQAYMNVTLPMANLLAGRRIVKLGHGLILNETVDNLALSLPLSMLSLDLAYVKLAEPDTNAGGTDLDNNGILVNAGLKPSDAMNLSLFYFTTTQKVAGAAENNTKNAFGITADGQAGPLGVNVELDMLGGTKNATKSYKGTNLLLNVNGNAGIGVVGLAYIRITGASASSTTEDSNNSIAGDFVGGHGILLNDQTRYGGGVDITTRVVDTGSSVYTNPNLNSNFHAIKLYGVTKPTADSEAGIEIYPLVQLVDSAVLFEPLGSTSTDTNLGQEFNIYGGVNLDKNLKLSGVVAFFNTGDVIKDVAIITGATGNKNVTKINAALTYTF
jgi:hypothetical protein